MRRLVRTLPWVGLAALLYVSLVVAVSLTSTERILGLDQTKQFCGLYLDCHLGVAVVRVQTVSQIGDRPAHGRYQVVTLRYSNDARRAGLRMLGIGAAVRDAEGHWYARDLAAEQALAADGFRAGLPDASLPAGGTLETRVVFDLPDGATHPLLWVHDASLPARLTELLLPGDEDSFLHRRTFFALTPDAPTARIGDLAFSVVDIERDTATGEPHPVPADGVFYLVTVALRGHGNWNARLVDDAGRPHDRAWDVEQMLGASPSGVRTLVFDVPDGTMAPTLEIRPQGLFARSLRIPLS